MQAWKAILTKALRHGVDKPDRTGIGTYSLFGEQVVFDNRDWTFPAVTTKELKFRPCMAELAAFLKGCESLDEFHGEGCRIWDANGTASYWKPRFPGDLGRIYGAQWRRWRGVGRDGQITITDQLKNLIHGIEKDPHGRRHLVTAWNPGELDQMCLPPCPVLWQCYVRGHERESNQQLTKGCIDLIVVMRSVDLFLGLPFDVASYAVLQKLVAKETGYSSGFLTFQLGDAHLYKNHVEAANLVLSREEMTPPVLWLDKEASVFNFSAGMADLQFYQSHQAVPAVMNV